MVALNQPVRFEWDAGNERKSLDKHGVSRAEAEQVFLNEPLLLLADAGHSLVEPRYHVLGITDEGRRLQVSFTLRQGGATVRVISARAMSRKERALYDQET